MSTHAEHGHGDHGGHASVKFYWMIGVILAVLTAVEVAVFYMDVGALEVPLLLILSAVKFALVVGFFMHLKFDHRVFTAVFVTGLILAVVVVSALIMLYHFVPGMANAGA